MDGNIKRVHVQCHTEEKTNEILIEHTHTQFTGQLHAKFRRESTFFCLGVHILKRELRNMIDVQFFSTSTQYLI